MSEQSQAKGTRGANVGTLRSSLQRNRERKDVVAPISSRYRAARIGVDVNLHTGQWSFEQAVKYFMDAGGLDREAAEGEAAGAASSPSQKISYITGKWQIMRLLGRYRDSHGENFRLGAFHDQLISYGTLPLSVIEWLMFDDESCVREALK